jgi:pantetheine-phosphate adenylyltransferase
MLEPISVRIDHVKTFLHLIARHLELELLPIQDIYGPTAYDPEISALVISEETRTGADSIATLRNENNLQPLKVYIIDVIGDKSKVDKISEKMSSTKIRARLSLKKP